MAERGRHYHMKDYEFAGSPTSGIVMSFSAEVVDLQNQVMVDACIKAARNAGVNDLYLMDRQFVLDALFEKIHRTQQKEG